MVTLMLIVVERRGENFINCAITHYCHTINISEIDKYIVMYYVHVNI